MNDYPNIIFSEYDHSKIIKASHHIRSTYNVDSIIYASPSFIDKIIDSYLNITIGVGDTIPNKSNEEIHREGYVGKYAGTPIICIKELDEPMAIILPNFKGDYEYEQYAIQYQ